MASKKSLYKRAYWLFVEIIMNTVGKILPDTPYHYLQYFLARHKPMHLKKPILFNEKIQWLKLHYRKDICTQCADKYAVREYVKNTIGEEYLIKLLGVWNSAKEIDFDSLPAQFVLKCNHDSGSIIICKDKAVFDKEAAREHLQKCLEKDWYASTAREWVYKNIPRKIIAEEYVESGNGELTDYKLFCFNGKVKFIQVMVERFSQSGTKEIIYDENLNLVPNVAFYYTPAKNTTIPPPPDKVCCNLQKNYQKDFPLCA